MIRPGTFLYFLFVIILFVVQIRRLHKSVLLMQAVETCGYLDCLRVPVRQIWNKYSQNMEKWLVQKWLRMQERREQDATDM